MIILDDLIYSERCLSTEYVWVDYVKHQDERDNTDETHQNTNNLKARILSFANIIFHDEQNSLQNVDRLNRNPD